MIEGRPWQHQALDPAIVLAHVHHFIDATSKLTRTQNAIQRIFPMDTFETERDQKVADNLTLLGDAIKFIQSKRPLLITNKDGDKCDLLRGIDFHHPMEMYVGMTALTTESAPWGIVNAQQLHF